MMIQKKGKKRSWNRAAVSGFCIWMSAITTMQSIAGVTGGLESVATWSNAQANMNTASDANARLRASVTGDLCPSSSHPTPNNKAVFLTQC